MTYCVRISAIPRTCTNQNEVPAYDSMRSVKPTCPSISMSKNDVYISILIYLFTCLSIHLSICLFDYTSTYLHIYLYLYLRTDLAIHPSNYQFIHQSINPYNYLLTYLSISTYLPTFYLLS